MPQLTNLNNLKMGHVNIRSLLPSVISVRNVMENLKLDILGISESWLSADTPEHQVFIQGYKIYRVDIGRRGDGVAIYVRNSLKVQVVDNMEQDEMFEQLRLTVKINNINIEVGVFYKPPRFNAYSAINILEGSVPDYGRSKH